LQSIGVLVAPANDFVEMTVPSNLSDHPKDLYDALEVEFNKAIINNPTRRNKTRLTFKDRGHMIRHLIITESIWQSLPIAEKDNQERNRR
jgi:hypothetical protein